MVRALAFVSWPGHCIVFLRKTLDSNSAFLNPVYKWVLSNLMLGVTCNGLSSHLGGGEILIITSLYRPRPD